MLLLINKNYLEPLKKGDLSILLRKTKKLFLKYFQSIKDSYHSETTSSLAPQKENYTKKEN
ncbi:hypothetical protein BpHYR1_036353 [Brachionus plicatilis]|uniref:Uncharacterized protein n=1 Tax=Brachionus plicatilis TaxID=10195 RepID=A0A3M7QEP1_BRAPC|nr:hypothetical protein BpHYR1_036353 [Brachionus plicatilis]